MMGPYAVLAAGIRQDVAEIERVVARVERALEIRHQPAGDRDIIVDATALNLQSFYTGLERIFTQVASTMDQSVPSGPHWHRTLLRQMTLAFPGVRPPVLSTELAGAVAEFLRFRHVVRNVYTFDLEAERVEHLAARLRPTWSEIRAALLAFAAFLNDVAESS